MKTLTILDTFDAYPGKKKRTFAKGDEVEVADALADTLIDKGLARLSAPAAVHPKPRPAEAAPNKDMPA